MNELKIKKPMKTYTFRLTVKQVEFLEQIAKESRCNRSQVLSAMIDLYKEVMDARKTK